MVMLAHTLSSGLKEHRITALNILQTLKGIRYTGTTAKFRLINSASHLYRKSVVRVGYLKVSYVVRVVRDQMFLKSLKA
jgi:hypothetical protein